MKLLTSSLWSFSIAAFVAGCTTGPQSMAPAPLQHDGRIAILNAAFSHPNLERSWMRPEAKRTSLLYVSNVGTSDVTVYTYLNGSGLLLVGTLTGFSIPAGMCTDTASDVWVMDYGNQEIEEFPHGGTTPIAKTSLRDAHPFDCSVDPHTGNVAVAAQKPQNKYYMDGIVLIYPKGLRRPAKYRFAGVSYLGYDDKSNLLIGGDLYDYSYALYELLNGSNGLQGITLNGGTFDGEVGAIDWVNPIFLIGENDVGSGGTPGAYKTFVSGKTATVVGTLQFSKTQQTYQFWRRGARVVVPDHTGNVVRIYNLSDGSLYNTLSTNISLPFGAVVSQ